MATKKPTRDAAAGRTRPPHRSTTKADLPPQPKRSAYNNGTKSTVSADGLRKTYKKPSPEPAPDKRLETHQQKMIATPAPRGEKNFAGERIAKVMARAGVCSRRDAEEWIAQGRITVNGRVLKSPAFNVSDSDQIAIDGAPMQARERTRLFLFHKPAGLITSASDPEGRRTVFSFLETNHLELPRVVSVGRLDINTEGLLLLTNDGGLARTLELPATGWTRRYRVRVHGFIDQARLDVLRKGITIDSIVFGPIEAQLERVQGANAWIAVSLTEGKNREIKRVMQYLGLDVTRLIRISYGPFQLADLPEGAIEEVRLKVLRDQLGKQLAELADVDFSSPVRELTATEKQQLRERLDTRSRKHISVLRQQREELNKKGPRTRIEKSATADRKGRAVTVERIAPAKPDRDPDKNSRNARRFDALRDNRSWGGSRSSLSSPDASAGHNRGGSSDFRNKQSRHKHSNSTYAADDQAENRANQYSRDNEFTDVSRAKKRLNHPTDDRAKRYPSSTAKPYSVSHKTKKYDGTSDDDQGRKRTSPQETRTHRNVSDHTAKPFEQRRNHFSQSNREGDGRKGPSHKTPTSGPRRPRER